MLDYTILDFDTNLFDFKVARITKSHLEAVELQKLLMSLAADDVRLVYWQVDSRDAATQLAAKQLQGFLASQQVTYRLSISDLPKNLTMPEEIEFYTDAQPTPELESLAPLAGTYSHFKTDPKFSHALFLKLYTSWIKNSINGKMAEAVLVATRGDKIIGMITCGKKNARGDLGLLAVNPEYRKQNIGTRLIRAVQVYWREHGFFEGQVITQLANKPACALYEKCGFKQEKIDNFYHFWL